MAFDRIDQPSKAGAASKVLGSILLFGPALYLGYEWFADKIDLGLFAHEWGALEILHSLLTALATSLFYRSWRDGKGAVRVAGGALTMLAAAAFVREIDLELVTKVLGWKWLVWAGEHSLQEVALVAMTLPIFAYLFVNRSQVANLVRLALRWQAWALYLSGFLVLLCVYLDERVVHDMRMRFWEELIETYSYVFMVLAAWRHLQLVGDPDWDRDDVTT